MGARAARTPLPDLLGKLSTINAGTAVKTRATNNSILKIFKATWKPGLAMSVSDVEPSQIIGQADLSARPTNPTNL